MNTHSRDPLTQELQSSAPALPTFSETLHVRVMESVRAIQKSERPLPLPAPGVSMNPEGNVWIRHWRFAAVVAGIAIGAWIFTAREKKPGIPSVLATVQVPRVDELVRQTISPLQTRWDAGRFGYLDRDGKRLGEFLLNQIPEWSPETEGAQRG
jgi:hypothetical protein